MLGLLLMFATAGAAYLMLDRDAFTLDSATLTGDLRYTSPDAVLARAGVPAGSHPNVVWLRSDEIRDDILTLPAISDAQVQVLLPGRVDMSVTERQPVFAIKRGDDEYLVDGTGVVLAHVLGAVAESLGIPIVDDQRAVADPIDAGSTVDPIELAAILHLGAISPALIDSSAGSLDLALRDDDGFVMTAQPSGWQAIFGQYTPNLRPTDLIPRQVQCLRSLLGASESDVRTVYLAPLDDRCGTYLPIATPVVPTPAPTRSR